MPSVKLPAPKAVAPALLAVAPVPKAVAEFALASERVPKAKLNEPFAEDMTPTATEALPATVLMYCFPSSTLTRYCPVRFLNSLASFVLLNASLVVPAAALPDVPFATRSKSSPPMATAEFPMACVFAPIATA